MPVLPLVGSMTVLSLVSCPDFSACSIMYLAMRSLTEPPTLNFSIFTYISTLGCVFKRFIFTIGVLPIKSKMFLAIMWHLRSKWCRIGKSLSVLRTDGLVCKCVFIFADA